MMTDILFFIHSALLLLFGVFLSAAFCEIKFNRKNIINFIIFSIASGALQVLFLLFFSEDAVWKIYPLISHLPLVLMLLFGYRKKASTAIVSVCTAYLCCQPAKLVGIFAENFVKDKALVYIAQIITLICVFLVLFFRFSENIAEIFGKDSKSVFIFGTTPIAYYVFDYIMVIFVEMRILYIYESAEFLAFLLCIIFLIFCLIYHKEYEQKADAQRREQIIRIALEQQQKELEAEKRGEQAIRIMRHDMRHFLSNLLICIDNDDKETARKMISSSVERIDNTVVKKYCENATLNYILSGFNERCREEKIDFDCKIESEPLCDETMLSTIISNALDNAINAQKGLPFESRNISLLLRERNGKMLLSVKNPFLKPPIFIEGKPVSDRENHGYGTQSIIYLTEKLGGNCKFAIEDNKFILMVVI
ncbi:MAG: sensor histidine kinase [Oscillospiraceae bacterium]|nr:sensor histidine kinase [Oscillospiraceae bacterium]